MLNDSTINCQSPDKTNEDYLTLVIDICFTKQYIPLLFGNLIQRMSWQYLTWANKVSILFGFKTNL